MATSFGGGAASRLSVRSRANGLHRSALALVSQISRHHRDLE
jgi:hypothetical protein